MDFDQAGQSDARQPRLTPGRSFRRIDLTRAFSERLPVELELMVFGAEGRPVEAISDERADIGFFTVDLLRAQAIAFTVPDVLIEGFDLVRDSSSITGEPGRRPAAQRGGGRQRQRVWAVSVARSRSHTNCPRANFADRRSDLCRARGRSPGMKLPGPRLRRLPERP